MQTIIPTKDGKDTIITQQYISGLYVAIYKEGNAIPIQISSKLKEKAFHKKLRKNNLNFIQAESSII